MVLRDELGLRFVEPHPEFWSDNDHPQDNDEALGLIQRKAENEDADVFILVTHLEYAAELPGLFCEQMLDLPIQSIELEKGQAIIISCDEKTTTIIP